jgi:hypothetical protein
VNEAAPAGEPPAEPEEPDAEPEELQEPDEPDEPDEGRAAETTPEPEERRYPSTIGGAFYLLILAVTGVGVVATYVDNWRLGIRLMGGALIAAGALRLVLRQRDAGMLAVRHRLVDTVLLVGMGAALVFLAGDIPGRPGT